MIEKTAPVSRLRFSSFSHQARKGTAVVGAGEGVGACHALEPGTKHAGCHPEEAKGESQSACNVERIGAGFYEGEGLRGRRAIPTKQLRCGRH